MEISPIKPQSTLESAIDAIRVYITENHLEKGASLPPENTLSNELGISRNIVREALQHYRTLGVIVSKQKIGATIAELMPSDPYANYMPFLEAESMKLLPALAEARYCIELGAVDAIVRNATAEDVQTLKSILSQMRQGEARKRIIQLDIEFHQQLLSSTHNTILCGLIPLLVNFFSRKFQPRHDDGDTQGRLPRRILTEHSRIIKAIEERDAQRLRDELSTHIGSYLKILKKGH